MSVPIYEIVFEGQLSAESRLAFEPLRLVEHDGSTRLVGRLADQAALHGVLARLETLGLRLVAVHRQPPARGQAS